MKAFSSGRASRNVGEALLQLGVGLEELAVEGRDRAERQQAHHGAHLEALGPAIGQPEDVVEEPVLLVPHPDLVAGMHEGPGDPQEMLGEFQGHVDIGRPLRRQRGGDLHHVLAEERHPGRAVRLLEVAAGGQGRAAVEDADIVEAQEPAFEGVLPHPVLAVHPPCEIERPASGSFAPASRDRLCHAGSAGDCR